MNEHKKLAIQALSNLKGDDTIRAKMAFSQFTPLQMPEQYGYSGKTRQQILDEYIAHDAKVDAAIEWIESQGD